MKLSLDGIGNVTMVKNKRYKNLRITVKPYEGVKVTMPNTISYQSAVAFINTKKDWIEKSVSKMKTIEEKATIFNENTVFHTKYHQLQILRHKHDDFHLKRFQGIFTIYCPEQTDLSSENAQEAIKNSIIWLLRKEAKSYLPFRVMHLAEKHNFTYKKVYVKNMKTRWGSCSYHNNINLNIHLMRLPDHLIDYVILHELTHTIHKNHSQLFWDALDNICPESKKTRKEMRNYSTGF